MRPTMSFSELAVGPKLEVGSGSVVAIPQTGLQRECLCGAPHGVPRRSGGCHHLQSSRTKNWITPSGALEAGGLDLDGVQPTDQL